MDKNNYYERHHWYHEKFFFAPEARRVMDYLIENTTTYPRCVDGRFLSPGRIITTRRRICHDLGISLRDLVSALNRLDLHHLISRRSYADSIDITLPLNPDEVTPPPSPEANEVGAQYIAPAPPALTPPNPPSLLYGSGQRPRQKPHSGDNFVGTGVSPCKSVALDRPIRIPNPPIRGAPA